MSHQSRKHARAVVQLVARYRSPTVFNFVEDECYDLSTGGMFISSTTPAPPGTLLKLECDEAGGSGQVKAIARVVWLRHEADQDGPQGMGVKFVKIDTDGQAVVDRLIEGRASMLPAGERFRGSSLPPTRRQELASMPADEAIEDEICRSQAPPTTTARPDEGAPVTALMSGPPTSDEVDAPLSEPPTPEHASANVDESNVCETEEPTRDLDASEPDTPRPNESTDDGSTSETSGPILANKETAPEDETSLPVSSEDNAPAVKSDKSGLLMGLGAAALLALAVLFQGLGSSTETNETNGTSAHAEGASTSKEAPAVPGLGSEAAEAAKPNTASTVLEAAPARAKTPIGVELDSADSAKPEPAVGEPSPPAGAAASDSGPEKDSIQIAATANTPYILNITVRPKTARLTIPGGTLTKPGEYTFPSFDAPIRIRAEKPGYRPTAATVSPADFRTDGDLMRRQVYLKLRKTK